MRIAIVRNRSRDGVISRLGPACPETYGKRTITQVVAALKAKRHAVTVLEGDKTLLMKLEELAGSNGAEEEPRLLVFNMAYGIQGEARYSHVPAMLELAGVPYTGASPLGHAVSLDKPTAKRLLQAAGIPTPAFALMRAPRALPPTLQFPVIVKPRRESTSYGLALVHNAAQLKEAVETVVFQYEQEALVEQYIEGREVCAALLGNDPPRLLPLVELCFAERALQLVTWDDKYHRRQDEPDKRCPAPLAPPTRRTIEEIAKATFATCQARDYARVDIRIDSDGHPWVLEINSMASLGGRGSYVHAARVAGYAFNDLINRIVDEAYQRHFTTPASPLVGLPLLEGAPKELVSPARVA